MEGRGQSASIDEARSTPPLEPQAGRWLVDAALILLGVFALAAALWLAVDVLLLLFGSVLIATALRAPTRAITATTSLPNGAALALTILVVTLAVSLLGWFLVPRVSAQLPDLIDSLTDSALQVNRSLGLEAMAERLGLESTLISALPSPAGVIGGATSVISRTFGVFANVLILVVVAIYLAAAPRLYVRGAVRLLPKDRRSRARETMSAIARALRWWIIGQSIAMTVVGLLSFVGLTLLGVPLALALATIAFLTNFVPFIGPIVSGIPAVLVGLTQGPETALGVLLLYVGIQSFEGYVLTPMVQRRSVDLPPALTIAAQVVFGVLFGALGVIFATPLAAAGLVAVNMLYVEDVLGDREDGGHRT